MAKWQNSYRDNLDEEITESVIQPSEGGEEGSEENLSKEEANWKKRYGDLRSHEAKKANEFKKEIDALKEQLDAATKKQIKYPKSLDEVKAWAEKYPDVYQLVDTIAQWRAIEAKDMTSKELGRVKELEKKIQKEKDEMELSKLHPDFFTDLIHDDDFVDWLDNKAPKWANKALREDDQSVHDAAEAIDYYKKMVGKKKGRDTTAAKSVSSRSSVETPEQGNKWTESRVAKLSDADWEKYEPEIMKAMRSDPGFYDISGGSR